MFKAPADDEINAVAWDPHGGRLLMGGATISLWCDKVSLGGSGAVWNFNSSSTSQGPVGRSRGGGGGGKDDAAGAEGRLRARLEPLAGAASAPLPLLAG